MSDFKTAEDRPAPTYKIHTFGCKVNTYDTSLLQSKITKLKPYTEDQNLSLTQKSQTEISLGQNDNDSVQKSPAQNNPPQQNGVTVHILNSCAVTHEATKEAGKLAKSIKKKDEQALVVLTGCAAQVDQKFFADHPHIDMIVGNSHKGDIENLILKKLDHQPVERLHHNTIFKKEDLEFGGGLEASRTRAFLKIQDGCNSFCSFCVIPFARGKSRSIPIDKLVAKVNEFYDQGLREVILTGVHVGDYEDPSGKRLEDLVEAMLSQTEMPRFRVTSLEPIEVTERLLQSYQNPRMCPHFHMSIQSAQSKVLKDMKRQYTAQDVAHSLKRIKEVLPEAFIGMDVIVGFPGETADEFKQTCDLLASLPWTRIHVFPYSPRPKTRALMMEGSLHRALILERSKTLRDLSHKRWLQEADKQMGTVKDVLLLSKKTDSDVHALSRDYWNILIDQTLLAVDPEDFNEELKVKITEVLPQNNGQGHLRAIVVQTNET